MTADDPGLQELVNDFVTESREHLGSVETDLLSLENSPESAADTVNRVFRGVHSVKGVAGFLGLDCIQKLAHGLESVLDLVRKDRLAISAELTDVLLAATDRLRELIEKVTDSNTMAIDDQLAKLQQFLDPKSANAPKAPPAAAVEVGPTEWLLQLSLVLPRIALAMACPATGLPDSLAKFGRVAQGGTDLCQRVQGDVGREPVVVQLVTVQTPEAVRVGMHLETDEVIILQKAKVDAAPSAETIATRTPTAPASPAPAPVTAPRPEVRAEARVDRTEPVATAAAPAPVTEKPKADVAPKKDGNADTHAESIRVSVHLLDRLMNLSGELVLGRNQLLQARSSGNDKGAAAAASRLSQVVSEVQEAVMQTRMQPIGTLFSRFPRVVRDLAAKLGKRCRLDIEGKEVDLDRSILEALSDPLTHLIRNSVDHGMELPEQRRLAGKEKEGVVRLLAAQQGGNVRIEIRDDGRGIDPHRLKKKATERGLLSPEQAHSMSDREAVLLIFAPGFSTAEKVTDVSGRGVGMDVVRSNIERLGGHVDVDSTVGKGTTIAITIPLTLAILPAMVVSCGARRYVLAQANVAELVRVRNGEGAARIVAMNGREVLRLRGSVLPLLRLRTILSEPKDETLTESTIIVIESANLRYGVVVDAPPDAEEIVVKPLGRFLKKRVEYAGATILGDGRVAMILDAAGLAEAANLAAVPQPEADVGKVAANQDQETADLVLFRNHPGETFAVPLSLVDRIQRIEGAHIQEIGGNCVFADGDRALPIVRLEGVVRARPVEPTARVSVLVLRIDRHQFGVVAPTVEDIRALTVSIDDRTLSEVGVLGSFQLDGRTVRLLDPTAMAKKALPQLFVDVPAATDKPSAKTRGPVRILFAEDTKFFREHAKRTLTAAGFDVTACADGELAWQELAKPEATFDIVVTDIQMPNCDGIELTRRIRREDRLRSIPVIALTSLSSAEHQAEGMAAGVTNYLVKLDDAALVAAVREQALAGAGA